MILLDILCSLLLFLIAAFWEYMIRSFQVYCYIFAHAEIRINCPRSRHINIYTHMYIYIYTCTCSHNIHICNLFIIVYFPKMRSACIYFLASLLIYCNHFSIGFSFFLLLTCKKFLRLNTINYLYQFPEVTQSSLEQQKAIVSVLEAVSLKSRCWQACHLWNLWGIFPGRFLASGGLPAVIGIPFLRDASLPSAPSRDLLPFVVSLSTSTFSFDMDTGHIGLGPTLMTLF